MQPVEMSHFSLCVITMMMVKLQQSYYAMYVEIYVLTVTDSFIFIGEPKLIKDRWRLLSLRTEQHLKHKVYSLNFEINMRRRLGVMGKKWTLDSETLVGFPAVALINCVNKASHWTSLRLSFYTYRERAVIKIKTIIIE